MPRRLDDAEVRAALADLQGWSGDSQRIRRTVLVPNEHVEALLGDVSAAEEQMNHHAVVERGDGSVTFVVWTHSVGGVTALDVELARHIDDAVWRADWSV